MRNVSPVPSACAYLTPAACRYCRSTKRCRRQRRLECTRLGHHRDDLCKGTQVDFALAGQNSPLRLKIEFENLVGHRFRNIVRFGDDRSHGGTRCCGSRMNPTMTCPSSCRTPSEQISAAWYS